MSSIRDIGTDILNAQGEAKKIATNSVESQDIQDDAVISAKIDDGSVMNIDLGVPKLVTYQETFSVDDMTDNEDATGEIELSTSIPEGAVFAQSFIDGVTGFAGDTSAVLTIGDGTDPDRYNTGTPDVFTTADHISAGLPSGTVYHSDAVTPKVTITSATDFGLVATDGSGAVTITLMWYQSV